MGFASRDSPSPKRQRFESRDSDSPRRQHSSRASSREASVERPQSRSSPTHPYSPSQEDKEAEDTSMPAPVKAMIDFILQSFPEATASPAHPSSRSLIFLPLQASQTLRLPRDRFWPGTMPCRMPFLTLKRRESLQFAYSGKRIEG